MRFLQTHVHSLQVQFEDIDAGGVVHHPRYLLFAERARYAALQELNFGFERQLQEGQTFVLAETMSRYAKPLSMGQRIWVLTRTVACRKSSLKAFQVILSREPSPAEVEAAGDNIFSLDDVVFMLQIRFVFLDLKSMKSREVPSSNRALLNIPEESFFEKNPSRRDVRLGDWPL
jgi:acyl-CoA thioester hydrolase